MRSYASFKRGQQPSQRAAKKSKRRQVITKVKVIVRIKNEGLQSKYEEYKVFMNEDDKMNKTASICHPHTHHKLIPSINLNKNISIAHKNITQQEIYNNHAKQFVRNMFKRCYHGTIFTYGGRSTGKSYTLGLEWSMGDRIKETDGIFKRFVHELFSHQKIHALKQFETLASAYQQREKHLGISISVVEVNHRYIRDLLNFEELQLDLDDKISQNISFQKYPVFSSAHLWGMVKKALQKRAPRPTSHLVIKVELKLESHESSIIFCDSVHFHLPGEIAITPQFHQQQENENELNVSITKLHLALHQHAQGEPIGPYCDNPFTRLLASHIKSRNAYCEWLVILCCSPFLSDISRTRESITFGIDTLNGKYNPMPHQLSTFDGDDTRWMQLIAFEQAIAANEIDQATLFLTRGSIRHELFSGNLPSMKRPKSTSGTRRNKRTRSVPRRSNFRQRPISSNRPSSRMRPLSGLSRSRSKSRAKVISSNRPLSGKVTNLNHSVRSSTASNRSQKKSSVTTIASSNSISSIRTGSPLTSVRLTSPSKLAQATEKASRLRALTQRLKELKLRENRIQDRKYELITSWNDVIDELTPARQTELNKIVDHGSFVIE